MLHQNLILSVRNLSVKYNSNILAVDDISFKIKKAEIFALTGESGSGKSSISFAIPRLLSDSIITGEVLFQSSTLGETDLLKCSSDQLKSILGKEISVIFQDPLSSFSPVFKCGEQVLETILVHNKMDRSQAKELVIETFSQCQLKNTDKVYDSYPHELSGGQLQRVAIAMGIANKPSLLIADEITSNLDSFTRDEILELLLHINKSLSLSILFVSHDINMIRDFCDEVLVLKKGQKIESGLTKEIFQTPKKDYTKSLISNSEYEPVQKSKNYNESILTVTDLDIEYKQGNSFFFNMSKTFRAVDKVTFDLKKGEILGLIGKSGSGKTSIGKSIVQLIDNYDGSISINGADISKLKASQLRDLRKSVQIIFQNPSSSLDPRLTIEYSLKEPFYSFQLLVKSESLDDKIEELLELVGLDNSYKNRLPDELSGGEKQRVCIARALSLNPEILICDEAVSSLDSNIKRDLLNLLEKLREERGLSILFISHDIKLVEYLCDRIISIEEGKIIAQNLNA